MKQKALRGLLAAAVLATALSAHSGKRRSPLDLASKLKLSTAAISFHYKQSPLQIVNNGHTIQAN